MRVGLVFWGGLFRSGNLGSRLISEANQLVETEKKADAKALYLTALGGARDDDQVKSLVEKLGKLGQKVDLPRHFGFITAWRLAGPFDNADKKGFAVVYPPELAVDFNAEYVCQNEQTEDWAQDWKIQLRVCDATGTAILSKTRGPAAAALPMANRNSTLATLLTKTESK